MPRIKHFHISNQAGRAVIKIIGEISWWKNNSEDFTRKVDRLIDQGIRDVDGYINSGGGSMLEANEIGNQIERFEGERLAQLGAICASAATIVSTYFHEAKGSSNTQYMIHDPRLLTIVEHEEDFDSQKQLYVNLRDDAIDRYSQKTGIDEDEISEMMRKTTWMNAKKAQELGFIDAIKNEKAELPADTQDVFNRYHYQHIPRVFNLAFQKQNHKSMSKITQKLGLKDDASEDEILAAIEARESPGDEGKSTGTEGATQNGSGDNQEDATDKAVRLVVKMGMAKGFKKETIESLAQSNLDAVISMIEEAPGSEGQSQQQKQDTLRMSDVLSKIMETTGKHDPGSKTEMTLKEMSKKAPEKITALATNEPEKFAEMFEKEYGIKPTQEDINALV